MIKKTLKINGINRCVISAPEALLANVPREQLGLTGTKIGCGKAQCGAQCGFCSPGFIVSAKSLLDQNPNPTREEVRDWFQRNRNACRCTGYKQLVDAVMDAAKVMRGEMEAEALLFKIPADGDIWGTGYPRPSAITKVTGTLDYGLEIRYKNVYRMPRRP